MGLTPDQYSIAGLFAAALAANMAGLWYTKGVFDKMVALYEERLKLLTEDRDEYKRIVFELLPINRDAIRLVEQTAKRR